jgi:hypothetical protein
VAAQLGDEGRDIPPDLPLVECFSPFLRGLRALRLSRQTLRRYRDDLWALGDEVIRTLQMDSALHRVYLHKTETNIRQRPTSGTINLDGIPRPQYLKSDMTSR